MSNGRRPTMNDVAIAAGVSLKTVSRVVNLEPGVKPDTQNRVLRAIEDLGYAPDIRARNLRMSTPISRTIGLILVDSTNPIASFLSRSVEDVARQMGALVIAGSSDEDPEQERELFRELVARRVDGLVMYPTHAAMESVGPECERGTSIVFVDRVLPGLPCDTITSDNRGGARTLTEHLIRHGHRRIAFLGDSMSIYTARERHAGYLEALDAAGIVPEAGLQLPGLRDSSAAEEAATVLLSDSNPPTALMTAVNLVTIGTIRALHRLGLQNEIALASFDDVQFGAELSPGITVVQQDPTEIGRRAAQRLFARLDGEIAEPSLEVLDVPLIARGSGELPPRGS